MGVEIQILFCTINTHEIDISKLAGGFINKADLICAHLKGSTKKVTVTKSEESLGMIVTDNAARCVFIKRIHKNSLIDKYPSIKVGDCIEQINSQVLTGMGHEQGSAILKDIPKGSTFILYLIEPKQRTSEESSNVAQVPIPSVDLTIKRACSACQMNDITNQAVVYCQPCKEFYCPSCRDCHKAFKLTRDHVLVTLTAENQIVKSL